VNFIERVMRAMTHLNLGAALGLAAWLLWSGWQVATGQHPPAYAETQTRALMSLASAGAQVPMRLVPVQAEAMTLPPCQGLAPSPKPEALTLTEADL
jgi:hypothetical protein